MSILEGSLASDVAAALEAASVPFDITIVRTTIGPSDPATPWLPGPATTTTHAGRGWTETYDDATIDGTVIDAKDVKVVILTSTIDIVPTDATDTITVDGATLVIINVKRDASGALFILRARS